jgi:hypothetical protein
MLRVQGQAPLYAARALLLAAALASASAFAEPAGAPVPAAPSGPPRGAASPPSNHAAEPAEPEHGLVAFSLVLSADPAPTLGLRWEL